MWINACVVFVLCLIQLSVVRPGFTGFPRQVSASLRQFVATYAHLGGNKLQNTRDFFLEIGSNILDFLYSKVAKANY